MGPGAAAAASTDRTRSCGQTQSHLRTRAFLCTVRQLLANSLSFFSVVPIAAILPVSTETLIKKNHGLKVYLSE